MKTVFIYLCMLISSIVVIVLDFVVAILWFFGTIFILGLPMAVKRFYHYLKYIIVDFELKDYRNNKCIGWIRANPEIAEP